ncbi:hypothetical protein CTAM01_00538 [Colletotrichum tamarilloi]|uniref:Uncharacterized protein n=1 Tax=Colletotrichum tamarilloi TaxID=1209934 RepID=A0ABQ9RUX2_9PEZI|nr:uncharacterized protein CTAM01_00538 [Colletotrichum tamarilloi]KAK1513142.1 hypothetical protein CTAM01_00538 [Colletotrichum tamarilloi]
MSCCRTLRHASHPMRQKATGVHVSYTTTVFDQAVFPVTEQGAAKPINYAELLTEEGNTSLYVGHRHSQVILYLIESSWLQAALASPCRQVGVSFGADLRQGRCKMDDQLTGLGWLALTSCIVSVIADPLPSRVTHEFLPKRRNKGALRQDIARLFESSAKMAVFIPAAVRLY